MCFLVDAHARAPHHQLFSRVLLVKKPIFKVDIRREWKRKLPEHREAQYLYRDYCTLDNVLLLCGHLLCLCSKDISIVSCKNPSVHLPPPTPLSLFQAIKAFVENSKYHFYVCTFIVCLQPRCTYIIITDIKEPDAMDMWICCEWLDITIHPTLLQPMGLRCPENEYVIGLILPCTDLDFLLNSLCVWEVCIQSIPLNYLDNPILFG